MDFNLLTSALLSSPSPSQVHFAKAHAELAPAFPDLMRPKSTKEGKQFQCPMPNCPCGYQRKSDLSVPPTLSARTPAVSAFFFLFSLPKLQW